MSGKEPVKPGRFDYVAYDSQSRHVQEAFKTAFQEIEAAIEQYALPGREKSLAFTAIEEAYMWVGKCIRNDQVARMGRVDLQEGRTNS